MAIPPPSNEDKENLCSSSSIASSSSGKAKGKWRRRRRVPLDDITDLCYPRSIAPLPSPPPPANGVSTREVVVDGDRTASARFVLKRKSSSVEDGSTTAKSTLLRKGFR